MILNYFEEIRFIKENDDFYERNFLFRGNEFHWRKFDFFLKKK